MNITIREYQDSDAKIIRQFIGELQDFVVTLDPIKRIHRKEGCVENTFESFVENLKDFEGKCFIAEVAEKPIGFIYGLIAKQSEENLLEVAPTRLGVVKELFVQEEFRKQNIGQQLLSALEDYFRKSGCDSIWIEVFAPNLVAHNFYKTHGYADREIGMLKMI